MEVVAGVLGKGLATEAAQRIITYASEDLKLEALVPFTVPATARSRRVMEKLGMTHDPAEDFDHPRWPVGIRSYGTCFIACQ
jgi:RimJ/RimL family protein N-acetyltransferase